MQMKYMLRGGLSTLLAALLAACSAAPAFSGSGQSASGGETPPSVLAAGTVRTLEYGTQRGRYAVGYRDGSYDHPLLTWVDYESLRVVPLCAAPNCAHDSENCTAWAPDGSVVVMWAIDEETMLKQVDVYGGENGDTRTVTRCKADGSDPVVLFSGAGGGLRMNPRFTDGKNLWYIGISTDESGILTSILYRQPLAGGEPQPVADGLIEGGSADGIYHPGILGCCGRSLVLESRDYSAYNAVPEPDWSAASTPEEVKALQEQYNAVRDAVQVPCKIEFLDVDTGEITPFLSWQAAAAEVPVCFWQDDTLYRLGPGRRSTLQWDRAGGGSGTVPVNWPVEEEGELDCLPLMAMDGKLIVQGDLYSGQDRRLNIAIDLTSGETQKLTLAYFDAFQEMFVPITILGRSADSLLVEFEWQASIYDALETSAVRWGLITLEDYLAGRPNYREIDQSGTALR